MVLLGDHLRHQCLDDTAHLEVRLEVGRWLCGKYLRNVSKQITVQKITNI